MRNAVLGLMTGAIFYAMWWQWKRSALLTPSTSSGAAEWTATTEQIPESASEVVSTQRPSPPPAAEVSAVKKKEPRVLCWVPTRKASGDVIEDIWTTWAKSCDKVVFTSVEANPEYNVVHVQYPTDKNLWNIIHPAWTYVEEHLLNDYDWFVKLDDDSYFCGENFKYMVKDLDPDGNWYLGHTVIYSARRVDDPQAEFNLGAGHALSRGSLRDLGPFLPDS